MKGKAGFKGWIVGKRLLLLVALMIYYVRVGNGWCLKDILSEDNEIVAVDYAPNGAQYAVGLKVNRVIIYNTLTRASEWQTSSLGQNAQSIEYSPDNKYLAVGHQGGIHVIDTSTASFTVGTATGFNVN